MIRIGASQCERCRGFAAVETVTVSYVSHMCQDLPLEITRGIGHSYRPIF